MHNALLVTLLAAMTSSVCLAQVQPHPMPYKDPGTATLISVLITGGGHIYAGETGKGAALLGIGIGAPIIGLVASSSTVSASCDFYSCSDDTNYTPLLIGFAAGLGAWIYGIADSGKAAHRMNAKQGLSMTVRPEPMMVHGNLKAGLKLQLSM